MNGCSNGLAKATLALAAAAALAAGTAEAASVALAGPATIAPGDTFFVSMSGYDFEPIVGGGADLTFASGLLELVSVSFDPAWDFYTSPGVIDNTLGKVTDLSFNVWGSQSGDFSIATLEFKAKAPGSAVIGLLGSQMFPFSTVGAEELAVGFSGASLQISPVPEPAGWLLMLSGLAAVSLKLTGRLAGRR